MLRFVYLAMKNYQLTLALASSMPSLTVSLTTKLMRNQIKAAVSSQCFVVHLQDSSPLQVEMSEK